MDVNWGLHNTICSKPQVTEYDEQTLRRRQQIQALLEQSGYTELARP